MICSDKGLGKQVTDMKYKMYNTANHRALSASQGSVPYTVIRDNDVYIFPFFCAPDNNGEDENSGVFLPPKQPEAAEFLRSTL